MTHPLTDEIIEEIATGKQWADNIGDVVFRHGDMRAAADWQLGQVIKWLENCSIYDAIFCGEDELIEELKQAMRPSQHRRITNETLD